MVRHREFDASEMSLASFMALVAAGDRRFVGLPIFPARSFRHRQLYVRRGAGIERPEDLPGKRVGVPDYHQTAALWARGFLLHDYGVAPETLRWVRGGLDRPGSFEQLGLRRPAAVAVEDAPPGRWLGEMLASGDLDAVIAPRAPADNFGPGERVRRLFPELRRGRARLLPTHRPLPDHAPRRPLAGATTEGLTPSLRRSRCSRRSSRPSGTGTPCCAWTGALADPWWSTRLEELDALFGGDLLFPTDSSPTAACSRRQPATRRSRASWRRRIGR